ncbi:alpha/beta fold hydrolase [Rhodococcus sp. G-MC3]|uniref:alpha/beta fold hydrolase n=1 Tax=Rhodococcus sp. G-MC3 TaxID=3046209 RepID=UPI0024BB5EDC|nr:alpha/beta fold hydrolase [Rhodococcus sp. G-MC3]MDJ0392450.1 alpha/beta fold hydrolase [Rhodococcus sp. G-MC3]
MVAAAIPGLVSPPTASAVPAAASVGEAFYTPPSPLPNGEPGDVIRSEPMTIALALPNATGQIPGTATRLMYRSTDANGSPNAVTGTYIQSSQPWSGPGPRPVVAVAVGIQGQGDQCAPSKLMSQLIHYTFPLDVMAEYEAVSIYPLLAQGMSVVVTDYAGLGTPAMHDYVNRASEAHAVLDSIRAAQRLPGSGVTATTPTIVFGYSQGGGAAAAAAESQAEYAPELPIRGTYSGAPPADLVAALINSQSVVKGPFGNGMPGGVGIGLVGYVINGIYADYPDTRAEIDSAINPAGQAMLREVADTCIIETVLRTFYRSLPTYTTGGRSGEQLLAVLPNFRKRIEEQRIGNRKPMAPVLVASGGSDDVIPIGQVRQLVRDWCDKGADVEYQETRWIPPVFPSLAIGHLLPFLPITAEAIGWVNDRLSGAPVANSCAGSTSELTGP